MNTTEKFFAAVEILKAGGWILVTSASEDEDPTDHGLLYMRGSQEFWLNHETLTKLPN